MTYRWSLRSQSVGGSTGTPSLLNKAGQIELFGGLLYTLGNKKEQAPLVPAFTNEKGRIAISYRTWIDQSPEPDPPLPACNICGSCTGIERCEGHQTSAQSQ